MILKPLPLNNYTNKKKSSSIHTPLISLPTPLLNTPHYYLFTPHSIKKYSHPDPIDTPQICSPKPSNPSSPFLLTKTKPPNPENRPSSAPREPTILRTETREPPKSGDQVSLFSSPSYFLVFLVFLQPESVFPDSETCFRISLNPVVSKHFGFLMSGCIGCLRI